MPIGDYCHKPAVTISAGATVRAAAQLMQREGLGSLAVVDGDRPVGIVSDRDLVLETLCHRLDPGAVTVGEIASGPLVTLSQDAPVREAARRIRRQALRRLGVVDGNGALVGILAADDLVSLAAAELSALAVAIQTQAPAEGAGAGAEVGGRAS